MSAMPIAAHEALENLHSAEELHQFLDNHVELPRQEIANHIHAEIVSRVVVDRGKAQRLSRIARWLAEAGHDAYIHGIADRCEGHVEYAAAHYDAALRAYDSAINQFDLLGLSHETAKTLTGSMQSLIYLGRNDDALAFAVRARKIFEQYADHPRLARLDCNEIGRAHV